MRDVQLRRNREESAVDVTTIGDVQGKEGLSVHSSYDKKINQRTLEEATYAI